MQTPTNQGKAAPVTPSLTSISVDFYHQCDETQPTCQRCVKSKRVCVNASEARESAFSIHIENRYASGKEKRPRGPRSSTNLHRPLDLDLQTTAFAYYLQFHLRATSDHGHEDVGGLPECVVRWKSSQTFAPMFDLAIASTALAVFARSQHYPAAALKASSTYYRLLRVARERITETVLSTSDQHGIDECLLSIFLMSRYETTIQHPDHVLRTTHFPYPRSFTHLDGAMAVLKMWKDNRDIPHVGATSVIKHTRRGLLRTFLLRKLRLPDWIMDGSDFGEHGRDLEYDRVFVQAINTRFVLRSLQNPSSVDSTEIAVLSDEVKMLDLALTQWASHIPSMCPYDHDLFHEHVSSSLTEYSSPPAGSVRLDPTCATVWSQFISTSMLINSTRLITLELQRPHIDDMTAYQQRYKKGINKIDQMAELLKLTVLWSLNKTNVDYLASSSYQYPPVSDADGEVKPHLAKLAVWPLTVASIITGVETQQQRWFKVELAKLGTVLGDHVLEYATTDQWITI